VEVKFMAKIGPRKSDSPSGSEFISSIINISSGEARDQKIYEQISNGNIPNFLRSFVPITVKDGQNTLTYNVMPDYISVGSDEDYVRVPVGASMAQKIADEFDCTLPTPKISDQIWSSATVKLDPKPMGASNRMTNTSEFLEHNNVIENQKKSNNQGQLVAGHKKDIVISNQLVGKKNRLGIHGLHTKDGKPIQGGALSPHSMNYTDYSHGIRLVDRECNLNGQVVDIIDDIAKNKLYAHLISNEGPLAFTSYNYESTKKPTQDAIKENSNTMIAKMAPKKKSQGRLKFLDRIFNYISSINA